MAHFARINQDWVVEEVISINDDVMRDQFGVTREWLGEQFCQSIHGNHTKWIQTSYSGSKYKNYAGIGYKFDPVLSAFIKPKPFDSWIFNKNTCDWDPPVPYPIDNPKPHCWDEDAMQWRPLG